MGDNDSFRHREPANTGSFPVAPGNALFDAAVAAIGFDQVVIRRTLSSILNTIGTYADCVSPDELGVVLPEVERRLQQLARPEMVADAMKRLHHVLFDWDATR